MTAQEMTRERHWLCARRMSERRHELGLTQYDIVERLVAMGVGATNRTLSAMEHGQGVDVGRLPELAVALECTVTYLLGLTADPHRWTPDEIATPAGPAAFAAAVSSTAVSSTASQEARIPPPRHGSSWILGPDVPDRHIAPQAGPRA